MIRVLSLLTFLTTGEEDDIKPPIDVNVNMSTTCLIQTLNNSLSGIKYTGSDKYDPIDNMVIIILPIATLRAFEFKIDTS